MILAPSLLSADWATLKQSLKLCDDTQVEYIHLDIMDGFFVPPITFGAKFIGDIRPHSSLFFDAHLMVQDPVRQIKPMIDAGIDAFTFHIEVTEFSIRICNEIREYARQQNKFIDIGIALNPQTPIERVYPILHQVDIVLLMSVEPGYGGQSFIPYTLNKIEALSSYRHTHNLSFRISVDGGVNKDTAEGILSKGADILVMGNAFFNDANPHKLCKYVRSLG